MENRSDEKRAELRSRLAYPIIVDFEKWVLSEYLKVIPKELIGKPSGTLITFITNSRALTWTEG